MSDQHRAFDKSARKNRISTISEFLLEAGTDYRIVDMGRGFQLIDSQSFLEIETGEKQPERPRQQMIWLGILFWNKNLSQQQYIWFIKLPLDEQGYVVAAQRDQFLQIIVEALGTEMLQSEEEKTIPDNPYLFKPSQSQISDFNSYSRLLLNLNQSQFYNAAKNYIARPDINNWQDIAQQGISDVAFNLNLDHNAKHIIENFDAYPPEVSSVLLASMENIELPTDLQDFLLEQLQQSAVSAPMFNSLLRALSKTDNQQKLRDILAAKLALQQSTQDNLIVLAGRHWQSMDDYEFLTAFFEETARLNIFPALYADLVQIPVLRDTVMTRLRDPNRSEQLIHGINQLFGRS